ncbi:hypothetical protein RB596_009492 [Gaeumannomyces avenae]
MATRKLLLWGDVDAAFLDFEEQIWRMATCRFPCRLGMQQVLGIFASMPELEIPIPIMGEAGFPKLWALSRLWFQIKIYQTAPKEGGMQSLHNDDILRSLVRSPWDCRDNIHHPVDLLLDDKETFMYGKGDFDSSWGAASRSILQALGKAAEAQEGPDDVLQGLEMANIPPNALAADTVHRELPEKVWLELHERLESKAKKCAARAEQVVARARAQLKLMERDRAQGNLREIAAAGHVANMQRQVIDVMEAHLQLQLQQQQQQQQPMPDQGQAQALATSLREIAAAQDRLSAARQQELAAREKRMLGAARWPHPDGTAGAAAAAAAAAAEVSETCNFAMVQRWIRSDRTSPPPTIYCPVCRDAEFTLASLRPAGFAPRADVVGSESGIVLEGCKHILGSNCFRHMQEHGYSDPGSGGLPCPMCRVRSIPGECKPLDISVFQEFLRLAVQERGMMDWP